jgi:hypothetical protein
VLSFPLGDRKRENLREIGFSISIVLNLSIVMRRIFVIFFLLIVVFPTPVQAQEGEQLAILSPVEGQILQGLVAVSGSVTVLGFEKYDLSFAYQDDLTQTWFVLASSSLPIFEGDLGSWDTTTLTDGDYILRLRVFLLDGSVQETTLSGLRVRNYTAIPTSTFTPTATAVVQFAVPTAQVIAPAPATVTPSLPTPTPLPVNPVSLARVSISGALGKGAILALLLFLGFGLLLKLRRD